MDRENNGARRKRFLRRAPFFACLICLVMAPVRASDDDYRVAAIIATDVQSMVLVQIADGEQNWYYVGDMLGYSRVVQIDPAWVTLAGPDGDVRLYLRDDDDGIEVKTVIAEVPPPKQVSRSYQFVNLISRVDTATPRPGQTVEQAVAYKLNEVLGLADTAKITSVGRVEVASASEARDALSSQLREGQPIRIMIDNAYTEMLYVTPEQ